MYKSIVVGVDGSSTAREALHRATALAKTSGARLHVVTAYPSATEFTAVAASAGAGVGGEVFDTLDSSLRNAAESLARKAADEARSDGIEAEVHGVEGDPSEAIIGTAEAFSADLIVVGNKGMRGAKRLLLGSVPNRVAHHAPCDVLIVHTV